MKERNKRTMKYLQCKCCNFLAVIPKKDSHKDLICPFCHRVGCNKGRFIEIDKLTFLIEADPYEIKASKKQATIFDKFNKEAKNKYNILLLPWQKDLARLLFAQPYRTGRTTLIVLLFLMDNDALDIYKTLCIKKSAEEARLIMFELFDEEKWNIHGKLASMFPNKRMNKEPL